MKVFSSIKNSSQYVIRCSLQIVNIRSALKENLSRGRSRNPDTSEIELFVLSDTSQLVKVISHLVSVSTLETVSLKKQDEIKKLNRTQFQNQKFKSFAYHQSIPLLTNGFSFMFKVFCPKSMLFKSEAIAPNGSGVILISCRI